MNNSMTYSPQFYQLFQILFTLLLAVSGTALFIKARHGYGLRIYWVGLPNFMEPKKTTETDKACLKLAVIVAFGGFIYMIFSTFGGN